MKLNCQFTEQSGNAFVAMIVEKSPEKTCAPDPESPPQVVLAVCVCVTIAHITPLRFHSYNGCKFENLTPTGLDSGEHQKGR